MNRGPRATRPEDTVVQNVSKKKLRVLLRLGRYMYRFKWGYIAAIAVSILSNLLSLVSPKLSGNAIDAIGIGAGQADFDEVARCAVLMVCAYLASGILA